MKVDIAIVGAGMTGASLAHALKGSGFSIALLDRAALPAAGAPAAQPSFDDRATALSLGSRRILERLGLWADLAAVATPIRRIEVSDRGHFGMTRLAADELRQPALGYVVENRQLGYSLLDRLHGLPGLELLAPAEVGEVRFEPEAVSLGWQSGAGETRQLSARLLVLADGGDSDLARRLQFRQHRRPYHQHALIANVRLDRPHQGRAWERFTERGPMALLPLADDGDGQPRAALVWTLPEDEADAVLALAERDFLARLQEGFGYRAGRITAVGSRHAYPLELRESEEQIRSRLVVLGNAAHQLHPVAGQGFNLALRDLAMLARLLCEAGRNGEDPGNLPLLERYLEAQRGDQQRVVGFSDALIRLFATDDPRAVIVRNLGLFGLDLLPPARQLFMRMAAGLDRPLGGGGHG